MKKYFLIFVFLGVALYYFDAALGIYMLRCNKVKIDFSDLNRNDFTILFWSEEAESQIKIYESGILYQVPKAYGPQQIEIIYKDSLKVKIPHTKTNRRFTHKYKFDIYYSGDKIYCDVTIKGKNPLKETFYLVLSE